MSLALRGLRIERGAFALDVDAVLDAPCTAILGPSGCGKTSLLEAVAGIVRPVRGSVVLDGEVLSDGARALPPSARRLGWVPQEGALFPHLSVRRNLLYGARDASGLPRIADVLGLAPLLQRGVPSLSGGEKRRVALGRALLAEPRLLLLDEPMTGLDRALKSRAIELLARVRDELRVPMLLVTHDDAEAEALASGVLRLGGE